MSVLSAEANHIAIDPIVIAVLPTDRK